MMTRVAIVGPCGAGKSTLARRIAPLLDLPVIHLDAEHWQPDWTEPPLQWWRQRARELAGGQRWIIDGNFGDTMAERFDAADTIIFLDFARWRCVTRVIRRVLRHRGRTRPDMAAGCPERWDWQFMLYVWSYHREHRPKIVQRIDNVARTRTVITLRTPAEVERFVKRLSREGEPARNLARHVLTGSHDAV